MSKKIIGLGVGIVVLGIMFIPQRYAKAAATRWSNLLNPIANLSLSMQSFITSFNWGNATGSSNLFTLKDSSNNTGTGYLFNVNTGNGSALKPLHIGAAGADPPSLPPYHPNTHL